MRIGLDVGGTKTDAVAVDSEGEVVARIRRATGRGASAVVATMQEAIAELCAQAGVSAADVLSVGVGIPGLVDTRTGVVLHAVNLGVARLALAELLGAATGVPVAVENDVKAAALGAARLRGEASSMAYLNLGTGVAAGIVVEGQLWRGSHGTAGEVGHLVVDPAGRRGRCGQHGCVESFAGGGAIAQAWGRTTDLPVRDVFDAADAGDEEAMALRTGVFFGVAAAVRALVLTADIAAVVLGGGLTALGDRLLSGVREELARAERGSAFLASLQMGERVELLPAGSPAAALGAALVGAMPQERESIVHG